MIKHKIHIIGKRPLCNEVKERAPYIGNCCFILCWRCTSCIIGYIIMTIFKIKINVSPVFLMSPLIIDSILQYFFNIESNNFRRIFTGILCGAGCFLF